MDRERDRDAAEDLIEEHDEKVGRKEPERSRPGRGDATSRPVDGQKLPPSDKPPPERDDSQNPDPGPFAPH